MSYFVYILKCCNNSYYVGHTANLEKRLQDHQLQNGAYHTRVFSPFELVYSEKVDSRKEAVKRESQIKKWSRAKKEALITGNWEDLKELSKKEFPKK